ncbi:MAG: hemolysin family protein [Lachnospiraceae bacterium]|nr:hemolysin family protein [Lachnospiraceae bacterium]
MFSKLKGLFNKNKIDEKDIISIVNEGHEKGVIEASEAEMISNIFEFGDKEAQDIMTHRENIIAIDGSETLEQVVDSMLEDNKSRYPVYEDNIDNIIGILHFKDTMKYNVRPDLRQKKISEIKGLIKEARFIPETRKIDSLFNTMQQNKIHMVIVVDEYGQTSGIVAMEDILEEIVGNILDEYDDEELKIRRQGDNTFIIEGLVQLEEVSERLGIEFPDEGYETLNGFMTDRLGHVPKSGEDFETEYGGYRFRIASVKGRVIRTVRVEKIPDEGAEPVDPGPDQNID